MPDSATAIFEARAALTRGDRASAKQLLIPAIRASGAQASGEVWWLLAQTLDDAAQQADCLQRATALGYTPPPAAPAEVPLELPVFPWDMQAEPAAPPAEHIISAAPADPGQHQRAAEPAAAPAEHIYSADPAPRKRRASKEAERPPARHQPAPSRFAEEDIAFVVAEFGRHEHRYEIIQKVMRRQDCVFTDAEELVAFVESSHSTVIAKKQLPLILVLSVAALIGGSYVVFVGIEYGIVGDLFTPRYYIRMGGGLATAFSGLVGLIQGLRRLRK